MSQTEMRLLAGDRPVTLTTRSRVPAHVRVVFPTDDDAIGFADTSNPMPSWRAAKLVERLRRSDHELYEVTWFRADAVPPDPDGCRRAEMPRNARVELLAVVPHDGAAEIDVPEARRLLRAALPLTRGPLRELLDSALAYLGGTE